MPRVSPSWPGSLRCWIGDWNSCLCVTLSGLLRRSDEGDLCSGASGREVGHGISDELDPLDGYALLAQRVGLSRADTMVNNLHARRRLVQHRCGEQVVGHSGSCEQCSGKPVLGRRGNDDPHALCVLSAYALNGLSAYPCRVTADPGAELRSESGVVVVTHARESDRGDSRSRPAFARLASAHQHGGGSRERSQQPQRCATQLLNDQRSERVSCRNHAVQVVHDHRRVLSGRRARHTDNGSNHRIRAAARGDGPTSLKGRASAPRGEGRADGDRSRTGHAVAVPAPLLVVEHVPARCVWPRCAGQRR